MSDKIKNISNDEISNIISNNNTSIHAGWLDDIETEEPQNSIKMYALFEHRNDDNEETKINSNLKKGT